MSHDTITFKTTARKRKVTVTVEFEQYDGFLDGSIIKVVPEMHLSDEDESEIISEAIDKAEANYEEARDWKENQI